MRTRLLLGAWLLVAAAGSGSAEPQTESTTEPPASSVIEEEAAVTSTSTSLAPPTTTLTPSTLPRFEPGDCVSTDLISLSRGSTHDLECGFVVVLENRAEPDGQTVSLPVAVARTRNADGRPDPVIYLAGGGGHAHLTYGHFFLESVGNAVLENRDFALLDGDGHGTVPSACGCGPNPRSKATQALLTV